MSRDESNALLALKNAWQGVIASAETLQSRLETVHALPEATPLADLDLDTYHQVVSAHATAAMALHGLIQELQRKKSAES